MPAPPDSDRVFELVESTHSYLLTREEDYAFGRPSLTRRKLRGLELKAKDGRRSWPSGHALSTKQDREREAEPDPADGLPDGRRR